MDSLTKTLMVVVLFFLIYFLLSFPQLTFFSPLYSIGTQLHIHVCVIFFFPIVVLHCKYLDIVLRATQQDLTVNIQHK